MLFSRCLNSTVLSFYVMPQGRHWGAPLMEAGLAGVIHDCQRADDYEQDKD